MVITKQMKEILDIMPQGRVFTIADFNVPQEYQPALVKALSRLVANDCIQKASRVDIVLNSHFVLHYFRYIDLSFV